MRGQRDGIARKRQGDAVESAERKGQEEGCRGLYKTQLRQKMNLKITKKIVITNVYRMLTMCQA